MRIMGSSILVRLFLKKAYIQIFKPNPFGIIEE